MYRERQLSMPGVSSGVENLSFARAVTLAFDMW
jgi:hypothetical protein